MPCLTLSLGSCVPYVLHTISCIWQSCKASITHSIHLCSETQEDCIAPEAVFARQRGADIFEAALPTKTLGEVTPLP